MASIRQTDTLHNKRFSKGRPAKPDRERNRKRQETYRWRDARRIYLANSFDRWRKLRSSLGLKDSVLAWHLMEAHEKDPCGICRRTRDNESEESPDTQDFLPQLIKSVRNVCFSQLHFKKCIRVVGYLCLEFDNSREENFNIDETILSQITHSNKDLPAIPPAQVCALSSKSTVDPDTPMDSSSLPMSRPSEAVEFKSCSMTVCEKDTESFSTRQKQSVISNAGGEHEVCIQTESDSECRQSILTEPVDNKQSGLDLLPASAPEMNKSFNCGTVTALNSSSYMESEAEVSLEIDVEKIDTSQEPEESICHSPVTAVTETCDELHVPVQNMSYSSSITTGPFNGAASQRPLVPNFNGEDEHLSEHASPVDLELPLDMSVDKADSHQREDGIQRLQSPHHPMDLCNVLSVDTSYSDNKALNLEVSAPKEASTEPLPSPHSSRVKEEAYPSIPWQRRDMSRKEEYEFLEVNPFCDLSEFSHRYPHVHQRTYYRWKRRIKEEYIILEQCPNMSFDEFSSVVLQAKVSVFNLWKSLIAQGKGFFAPSDVSKRLEAKCPLSKTANTLGEQYTFLQKNLSCTQEQFCQKFLDASPEVFCTLKKKVVQEFWIFYHNSHLDWREFCKLVDVSEEVYNNWRDYITRDIKSVIGGFTPNAAQMMSSHCPTFQNAPHLQAQMLKANVPRVESSTPEETRNLSASYLSSMQNMIFPWSSYYTVHNPINQQLLPMVMWPRLMSLNGGKPPALNLPMASPSSCGSQSESPHHEMSAPNQPHQQSHSNMDVNNLMEGKPNVFSPSRESESCEFLPGKAKRGPSYVPNGNESCDYSHNIKKQKVSEELDAMNSQSPVNKSRKQNKQEYVYYLKNPSLSFKDLETLFPSISLRTFYRWRKEMNAALLFMRENKDPNYQQFQLVFPDIPEDVFSVWRMKSGKENFAERILFTQNVQTRVDNEDISSKFENGIESYSDKTSLPVYLNNDRNKEYSSLAEASPSKKQFKPGHLFIHKNPNIDFTAFSKLFPHISARSFYRWKKEWKDAIDLLQSNPDLDYERYKTIDSSVSEEIFDAWKQFLLDLKPLQKEGFNSGQSFLSGSNNNIECADANDYSSRKHNCHEFAYLQLHSQIDFHDFNKRYPHISSGTFEQWQKDINQIISYVQSQPSVCFDEISAVLPGVTEEAFLKWKEQTPNDATSARSESNKISTDRLTNEIKQNFALHSDSNDATKMQITNALLHLMHNPNIEYRDFCQLFPIISPETFELWLRRIKYFIQQISSNPNLEFEEFRSVCNEIEEDVFRKWKSLTPEEICAIGNQSSEPLHSSEMTSSLNNTCRDKAFYYCQQNPHISYSQFSEQYCNTSETDFKCWILKISNQMSFIKDNPSMSFRDFNGIYPEVEKAIFDLWRDMSTHASTLPHSFKSEAPGNHAESQNTQTDRAEPRNEGNDILNSIRNVDSDHSMLDAKPLLTGDHKPGLYVLDNNGDDQESSLKKLAQLADRSTPYSCGLNSRIASDMSLCKDDVYTNHVSKSHPLSLSRESGDNSSMHDFTYGNDYDYRFAKTDQNLLRPDNLSSPRTSEPLYGENSVGAIDNCVENQAIGTMIKQENQSLSNLMMVSADHHKFSPVTSTSKMDRNVERASQPLTPSDKWNYAHVPTAGVRDDEEMFSSQRQKKMSRAEYLFVKDNPDVDSQEFARIFPGVSARTFYRWKKEIKSQMQVA